MYVVLRILIQCDTIFYLKIYIYISDIFHGTVILPYILNTICFLDNGCNSIMPVVYSMCEVWMSVYFRHISSL